MSRLIVNGGRGGVRRPHHLPERDVDGGARHRGRRTSGGRFDSSGVLPAGPGAGTGGQNPVRDQAEVARLETALHAPVLYGTAEGVARSVALSAELWAARDALEAALAEWMELVED